ncbi:MAG: hypothetical protein CL489_09015 [Acidobacteria bacterium]|nr:hypothetical protein [Acidobacteriota bacterium]|tara:strand:- start:28756 stop:30144 length:1389 start_codon:yes stop_codon:yes gene_type:complete
MILDILNELESTSSTKEKESILRKHEDNELLKRVFQLTYDKVNYTFNVKKIDPEWIEYDKDVPECFTIDLGMVLESVVLNLCEHKMRGHEAQQFLSETFMQLLPDDREVLKRVLKRDLRVKTSGSIANKVWKGLVPKVPQMLARPYKEKNLKAIEYPAIAQKKADGVRCIIYIDNGSVTMFSRNGNEFDLPTIREELSKIDTQCVIDGELLYSGDLREEDRQTGNGIVGKSLKGTIKPEEERRVYMEAWDIVPLAKYKEKGKYILPYLNRFQELKDFISDNQLKTISYIESHVVNNIDEAKELSANYIANGFEGIILKNVDAPWQDTRSKHQVKFKEVIDFDFRIVDVYRHEEDPNKLGGVTLESECGQIRVNCGSGFRDKDTDAETGERIPLAHRHEYDRELLWSKRHELIGKIVEGTCNGVTTRKNVREDEAPYKVFLPIFKCLRFDKDIANTLEELGKK